MKELKVDFGFTGKGRVWLIGIEIEYFEMVCFDFFLLFKHVKNDGKIIKLHY